MPIFQDPDANRNLLGQEKVSEDPFTDRSAVAKGAEPGRNRHAGAQAKLHKQDCCCRFCLILLILDIDFIQLFC
ncbi:hypothetical protein HI914_05948 [Erysiphe necator]|nr:hypothetical protein HI914_05948 [Erysiphe necator]